MKVRVRSSVTIKGKNFVLIATGIRVNYSGIIYNNVIR
jgi:hypothetical protein